MIFEKMHYNGDGYKKKKVQPLTTTSFYLQKAVRFQQLQNVLTL
jgi:hypothetical protein